MDSHNFWNEKLEVEQAQARACRPELKIRLALLSLNLPGLAELFRLVNLNLVLYNVYIILR